MKRRDFIKKSLIALPLVGVTPLLYKLMASKKGQQAQLEYYNPDFDDTNYIQLNFYGAPSRWGFDDLLTPYENSKFKKSAGVGNSFSDENGTLDYRTIKHNGLYLPALWDSDLTIDGNNKKLLSYLESFIFIRGIYSNNVGHPGGGVKTIRPTLDSISIMEDLAHGANSLMPPVMIGDNPVTRSFNSSSFNGIQVNTLGGRVFNEIFEPFSIKKKESFFSKDESLKMFEETIGLLDGHIDKKSSYYKNLKKTKELFFDDFESLQNEYLAILNRYLHNTEQSVKNTKVHGVHDMKIKAPSESDYKKLSSEEIKKKYGRFAIDMGHYVTGELSDIFASGNVNLWAEQFALTEFLIKKGLGSNVQLSTPVEMGHTFYDCQNLGWHDKNSLNKGKTKIKIPMDAHNTGTVVNNYATNLFFTGVSTCLITLIDSLKTMKTSDGATMFDKSLIHLTSEFNRITREDLTGSDHLGSSCNTTFITGKNKSPIAIGNIRVEDSDYHVTNGEGAIVEDLKRRLDQKDILHTAYSLLEKPSPFKRAHELLKVENGTVVAKIEKAKNI